MGHLVLLVDRLGSVEYLITLYYLPNLVTQKPTEITTLSIDSIVTEFVVSVNYQKKLTFGPTTF